MATGSAPLNYQWLFNGTNLTDAGNIFGSATNTLIVTNALFSNAGSYWVLVSNAYGSVTSAVATLTIVAVQTQSIVLKSELETKRGAERSDGS